jgi:hypothetical protein
VYWPAPADQKSDQEDCFYIVYLYLPEKTVVRVNIKGLSQIETLAKPHVGFCNKCLYISSGAKIYILNTFNLVPDYLNNNFVRGERPVKEIDLGDVINHGFVIER